MKMFLKLILTVMAVCCVIPVAVANDAEMAAALAQLEAELPGKLVNNPYEISWNASGKDIKTSVVKSEGAPGGMAFKVKVKKKQKNPWEVVVAIPVEQKINAGDVILISYWARSASSKYLADLDVRLGRTEEPYDSVFSKKISPEDGWKLMHAYGTAGADFPVGKTEFGFNMGRAKQTVEFGQFYIMNLGPNADASVYAGEKPKPKAPASTDYVSSLPVPAAIAGTRVEKNDYYTYGNSVTGTQVSAPSVSGGLAYRVTVGQKPQNPWEAGIGAGLPGGAHPGDVLSLSFWARSLSGSGKISGGLQRSVAPYDSLASSDITLSGDWKKYTITGAPTNSVPSGQVGIGLQLGHGAGQFEFGPYTYENLGSKSQ